MMLKQGDSGEWGTAGPPFPLSPLPSAPPLWCQLRLQQLELMNGMHACNNFVASVFLPSHLPTLLRAYWGAVRI